MTKPDEILPSGNPINNRVISDFDPVVDMGAIEGAIADLAARTDRPQGYPFSCITLYSIYPGIKRFMPHLKHIPASNVPSMRKLDFKKAGKIFGAKVQEMKNDLSQVPEEFIIIASRFDAVDEPRRKTTGCRKYMIEVKCEDQEDRWLVIQFRKTIKKYVTEDIRLNIVPPIFGDKYPTRNEHCVPRVIITLGDCSERLYQALLRRDPINKYPYSFDNYGTQEFAEYPIRLRVPDREFICSHMGEHTIVFGLEKVRFYVNTQ